MALPDGAGLAGAIVDLFVSSEGSDVRGQYLATLTTQTDGTYVFEDRSGCYIVTVKVPIGEYSTSPLRDWGEVFTREQICTQAESPPMLTHTAYPLVGSSIGGQVLDGDGQALAGIAVSLKSAANEFVDGALTDEDGRFRWTVATTECQIIVVSSPDASRRSFNRFVPQEFDERSSFRNAPACPGVDIESVLYDLDSQPGRIEGRIITSSASSPPVVTVNLFAAGDPALTNRLATLDTGPDGGFGFATRIACYLVRAELPSGYSFVPHDHRARSLRSSPAGVDGSPCTTASRQTVGAIEVFASDPRDPTLQLLGRVVNQSDAPVAGLNVDVFALKGIGFESFLTSVTTDAEGLWSYPIFDGCYIAVVTAPGGATDEARGCANGADINLAAQVVTS